MANKIVYLALGWVFYLMTIVIVGFAMVLLVQGFLNQSQNELLTAFGHYVGTVFLAAISLFFFKQGHKRLLIAESSP